MRFKGARPAVLIIDAIGGKEVGLKARKHAIHELGLENNEFIHEHKIGNGKIIAEQMPEILSGLKQSIAYRSA